MHRLREVAPDVDHRGRTQPSTRRGGSVRQHLHNLGHDVARNKVKRISLDRGIEPAPERGRHTFWTTFLRSHMGAIVGADYFTVEILDRDPL